MLTFVTGNEYKYLSTKNKFAKRGVDISFYLYDAKELAINDIEIISKQKVLDAYAKIGTPCFAMDSGFYIEDYPNNPGYPGAFVKRSGVSSNIDKLLITMKDVQNRNCKFLDCLTFYDGTDFYIFYGESKGKLAMEAKGDTSIKKFSNLWYIFIPQNCTKTLAEMTLIERENRPDNHTSAVIEFLNWYQNIYLMNITKRELKK